jgi:3-oxoadipate enol-lactonase
MRTRRKLVAIVWAMLAGAGALAEAQETVDARSSHGLAYDLVGQGPLVVLIHGTNLDRRMWDAEVGWLREQTRVLRYDLRGQGGSDFPTKTYSNHGDLIDLLGEVGARDVTLVGLSAGTQVAVDVALAAPDLVARMVLLSPSIAGYVPTAMPAFLSDLTTALRTGDFDGANEVLLASSLMSVPSNRVRLVRTMVEDNDRLWTIPYTLVEQTSPPVFESLEEIDQPTLVLVGGQDEVAIWEQGVLLERRMGDARSATIPGGHLLNLASPAPFRRAVSEFLGLFED